MKYPFSQIKIKHTEDVFFTEEEFLRKRKGEILHLALSFMTYFEDSQDLLSPLKKAFALLGEREDMWNVSKDFLNVLKGVFSLDISKLFFPKKSDASSIKILKERSFFAGSSLFRPDRVVIYPERSVVVDFKSHLPEEEDIKESYRLQVKGYCKIVSKVYTRPVEGYILYLQPLRVEKVKL